MNLLQETIEALKDEGLSSSNVLWVGTKEARISWDNFEQIANVEYSSGFGPQEVAKDLIIVGQNWWLERHEYDGSEW